MDNRKLHYAEASNNGDVLVLEFETIESIENYIQYSIENNPKIVYVLAFNDLSNEKYLVFVTEYKDVICAMLRINYFNSPFDATYSNDIHLHEYYSYEEAYEVALLMMEGESELCYDNSEINN